MLANKLSSLRNVDVVDFGVEDEIGENMILELILDMGIVEPCMLVLMK